MKTLQFRTNIKCSGCVEKITPFLDKAAGRGSWTVDLASADKTLTVTNPDAGAGAVTEAIAAAGYRASEMV
ncbi:heavy-metal-associated domain-containing protein [Compostibacter hankyongensis]|uniref:Copper chaperone n=1 Tax=Compostibacter hankyongensis TaxID=1007089 RepID=A0ABP8G0W9_9BACT